MTDIECIEEYERYLREDKGASGNTLSSYTRDIRQLSEYLAEETEHDICTADDDDLGSYITSLREKGKSVSTVSRCIASIKGMYTHLCINQMLSHNPSLKLVPEKSEKNLPEILTTEEVNLLLSQPRPIDAKGIRDKAMLELLYATGIRVSELIDLNLSDVDLSGACIVCKGKVKDRAIPMYPEAVEALERYITLVRPQMVSNPDEVALFVNVSGERMSRQGFWKLIKHYAASAKIGKDITPHTLRHSFAAHLLENGADIHSLQNMLGHVDVSSTHVYSNLVKKQLRDIYNNAHPMAL